MVQDFNEPDPKALPEVDARVSSDAPGLPDSLAAQKEEFQRFAAEHGFEVVGWYADERRGDVSVDRARFKAMLDAVQCGAKAVLFPFRSRPKQG